MGNLGSYSPSLGALRELCFHGDGFCCLRKKVGLASQHSKAPWSWAAQQLGSPPTTPSKLCVIPPVNALLVSAVSAGVLFGRCVLDNQPLVSLPARVSAFL